MKKELQGLLWFSCGFALAVILCVNYQAVRYVPIGVAFGLLCFGCGLLLFTYMHFRWRVNEWLNLQKHSQSHWAKEFNELKDKESALEREKEVFEADREIWEAEKQEFEEKKALWEALHPDNEG